MDLSDRDPVREREFLRGAERRAGLDIGWTEAVEDRILRSERNYGRDSYKQLGFWKCISEIEEEDLDLGGWPLMAWLLSYTEPSLDDDTAHEIRLMLQELAAYGVRAQGVVNRIRDLRP